MQAVYLAETRPLTLIKGILLYTFFTLQVDQIQFLDTSQGINHYRSSNLK